MFQLNSMIFFIFFHQFIHISQYSQQFLTILTKQVKGLNSTMITCIKGSQNSTKLSLVKKAKNLRQEAFKIPLGRYMKVHESQNKKPESFIQMFTKVTTKRKQQIKQIKKRNQQQNIDISRVLVGQPAPYSKLIKKRIKTQQETQTIKLNTFQSQFQSFNQSEFRSKISFGVKNKRLSMTNYSQRIWRGSNVNRQSSNTQNQILRQQRKSRNNQKHSPSPKDQSIDFKPLGNVKRKNTEGIKKIKQNQLQFKNIDIFLRNHEKQKEEEQQDQPLKQIYDKIQKYKNEATKFRANKNMRKLYSTYKIDCEKREDRKAFNSDKKIKVLMVQSTPTPHSAVVRKQSSKSVQQLGPWEGKKFDNLP